MVKISNVWFDFFHVFIEAQTLSIFSNFSVGMNQLQSTEEIIIFPLWNFLNQKQEETCSDENSIWEPKKSSAQ